MTEWLGDPLHVSNSEMQTWLDCRRRWYLTYYEELGLKRDKESPVGARQLGSRIHVALCALYESNANPVQVIDELYEESAVLFAEDEEALLELKKEQDLAHAMLEGYVEWLAETGADEGIELVDTETVLEVPSAIKGVFLRGKLDQRVIREVDQARLFLDHKTVGDLSTPLRTLPLDPQMKFYHLLEKLDSLHKTGDDPPWRTDGALYNMLRKVKRTANAKPPFYNRVEVHHNTITLANMWTRVHKILEELIDARHALDAGASHQYVCPPRPSRDCTWKCDFFTVCAMMDDGSNVDGLFTEYYEHIDPHERYAVEDTGKDVPA